VKKTGRGQIKQIWLPSDRSVTYGVYQIVSGVSTTKKKSRKAHVIIGQYVGKKQKEAKRHEVM
jgi:hypothetical protein